MKQINLKPLMARLNYKFQDISLLEQALSHCSIGANNNERLEFLGDSILNFSMALFLFKHFPKASEGQLSQLRAMMVKQETLAKLARQLKLGDYLILGAGELKTGGDKRASILADAMEAIIGAICLDSNMDICCQHILSWYHSHLVDLSLDKSHKDAKTKLQEYLQALHQPLPTYELKSVSGQEHARQFVIQCMVSLLPSQVLGSGNSRRQAEQQAANKALEKLLEDN